MQRILLAVAAVALLTTPAFADETPFDLINNPHDGSPARMTIGISGQTSLFGLDVDDEAQYDGDGRAVFAGQGIVKNELRGIVSV